MLSDRVTEAFHAAGLEPPRRIDVRRVLIRAKRRRRRNRALLTGSLVVVVAALAIAVTGLAVGGNDRSTLTPAATPSAVLETFAGVDVTVLPEGVQAAGGPDVTGPLAGNAYGLTQKFTGVKEPEKQLPPTLTVTVEKARPDLDSFARSQQADASWVTVSGQRALLVSYDLFNGIPLPRSTATPSAPPSLTPSAKASIARNTQPDSTVYWRPSPASPLTLRVEGQAGISLADVLAVARGLVLDPKSPQQPADVAAAGQAIKQSFTAAFTGGTPIATAAAAIQDGQGLVATLNELKAVHPETADNTTISVRGITYYDAAHALVSIQLKYQFGTTHSEGDFWIGALLLEGQWKVSRANYCDTISLTLVNCPASS